LNVAGAGKAAVESLELRRLLSLAVTIDEPPVVVAPPVIINGVPIAVADVTAVSSTTANGTYGVGSVITVTIGFSKPVTVTGTPLLALNSGGTASYTSGTDTSTLSFTHTVAAGQNSSKLDYTSLTALTLNGGTINDSDDSAPANLTLPTPSSAGSLGGSKSIAIDTTAPVVTAVSSTTANGTYGVGSVITMTVGYSKPVVVTGTPQLALNSGGTASYSSGSGTSTLSFTYTVGAGQNSATLDYTSSTALTLNGGTIFDTVTNPNAANLTLPAPGSAGSIGGSKSIAVDTTAPTVTAVTSTTANGTYGVASVITITVGFSKPVVVTGTPQLALNSGGTASYSSGSGTSTLSFTYTVGAGENTPKLDYTSTTALTLNGGTIFDTVTNPNAANLTLPAPGSAGSIGGSKSIVIDTIAPATVTTVSSTTADGSYGVGSVIAITVTFNKAVTVTGTPQLALNSGGTASYSSGSGTATLVFTYTVAAGQNSPKLDVTSTTALTLNAGTITDIDDGASASLTLPAPGGSGSLGLNNNIAIDTTAPTVTAVSSTTANGTYGVGSVITITMSFSKAVVVTGTPQLALNSGGTASYSSGSGTSTLGFTYTVGAGQNTPKLDFTSTTALTLNGGTIFDTVTNPNAANLTLPAPGSAGSIGGSKSIVIDTTASTVTGVSSTTANGVYGVGATITITIGFSKAVVVTGTPQLALNSGGTASFTSGSGTSTLSFTYVVGAGQNASPLDATSVSALTLNGGTIFDTVTNPNAANLALPSPGATGSLGVNKSIDIDTVAPTVISFDPGTATGTIGTAIDYTIVFSKPITSASSSDFDNTGTATISVGALSGLGTTTLDVPVTPTGAGTIVLEINSSASVTDAAGNKLAVPVVDTHTVTVAQPGPTAVAGGPYTVAEGGTVQLDATGSSDPNQAANTLTYTWDFNGDGVFGETGAAASNGDETGAKPTFNAGTLDGPQAYTVHLRVTDSGGLSDSTTATINITNTPPTAAAITGPANRNLNQSGTFGFGASDPSAADTTAGFTYNINWGDGSPITSFHDTTSTSANHAYANIGVYTISYTATDKDSGVSTAVTRQVTVGGAQVVPDPTDPTKTALMVSGTSGNDWIDIDKGHGSSSLRVTLNGAVLGTFSFTGNLFVFGQDGNDTIDVDREIDRNSFLYGGAGNDVISAGNGTAVAIGGDGSDVISTGNGRDILIGGNGADFLEGGNDDDILIGGFTSYDPFTTANAIALAKLRNQWLRTDLSYTARVNLLRGSALVTSGAGQNVFDDGATDHLIGGNGSDWFLGNFSGGGVLDLTDRKAGEVATDL
jgi:hypothetical protein